MSINAGMPVTKNDSLFGDTIQFAKRLHYYAKPNKIVVASIIKEITHKDYFKQENNEITILSSKNEKTLDLLMDTLEEKSSNPYFNVEDFCNNVGMSKSSLYRITQSLTGKSPNELLKEYRLQNTLELIKTKDFNISEAAFAAGFNSPTYFSKCFLKTYGILPSYYRNNI